MNEAEKRAPGRPALSPDQRSDSIVQIRTTRARKAKLQALAQEAGVSQTAWVEQVIDRAKLAGKKSAAEL